MAARTPDCTCSSHDTDPRIDPRFVRHIDGADGDRDVVLAGVVHDHPASVFRVQSIVGAHEPDALALELPSVALPLFEEYAEDDRTPPRFGGEMSAAIQAADGGEIVGIDAPSGEFFREVLGTISDERPPVDAIRNLGRGIASVTRHALECWVAGQLTRRTPFQVTLDDESDHGCDDADPPDAQAVDESAHVTQAVSLFRALDRPEPVRIRDVTREACMARKIDDLRGSGSVVAVVGHGHLDALAERLEA